MWTYRIKYAKKGRIRFTSHLDVMRALMRSFNRAELPLAYSEGFNPHPKLTMGPALPLGYESECELADVTLVELLPEEVLGERLGKALPEGLELLGLAKVLPSSPRLSSASSVVYVVQLYGAMLQVIEEQVKEFLAGNSAPVERVRKDTSEIIDVRHFVKDLEIEVGADCRWLRVEISTDGRGSCSATEVAQAVLHLSPVEAKCLHMVRREIRFEGRPRRKTSDAKEQEEESREVW